MWFLKLLEYILLVTAGHASNVDDCHKMSKYTLLHNPDRCGIVLVWDQPKCIPLIVGTWLMHWSYIPEGMTLNPNRRWCEENVAFSLSSSATSTCQYLDVRSSFVHARQRVQCIVDFRQGDICPCESLHSHVEINAEPPWSIFFFTSTGAGPNNILMKHFVYFLL